MLKKEDPFIQKIAEDFLKDPENEQQTFEASHIVNQGQSISEYSLNVTKPDYKKMIEIARQELEEKMRSRMIIH